MKDREEDAARAKVGRRCRVEVAVGAGARDESMALEPVSIDEWSSRRSDSTSMIDALCGSNGSGRVLLFLDTDSPLFKKER